METYHPHGKKIKIFSDGATLSTLLEMNKDPLIKGMTTNPTLMKNAGIRDYPAFCKEVLTQVKEKPISFEVFADDFNEMYRQALEINSWGPNIYVKIPVMNSEGKYSYDLVRKLSHEKVKLNVTAIYTLSQVYETCQSLKGGAPGFVSVLAGRIADTGRNPFPMMQASASICEATSPSIELLWAATREAYNFVQAEACGAHIITMPPDILKKVVAFGKDLNAVTLDAVKTFKMDAESAGFKL